MVIPGFVLAGGASRRMGQDKALLKLDGVALAQRTATVLINAGCGPVTVVGRQVGLKELGLPVIEDIEAGHHPLWGVAAALEALQEPMAIFAPCDLVRLTPAAVEMLLVSGRPCVATGPTHLHPLLAVLPRDMAQAARALATQGASARQLVSELPTVALPAEVLHDANRPVDLPQRAE